MSWWLGQMQQHCSAFIGPWAEGLEIGVDEGGAFLSFAKKALGIDGLVVEDLAGQL